MQPHSTAGAPVTSTPGAPAAPTASTVRPSYRSGHCSADRHTTCRGQYASAVCGCTCHDAAEAPPTKLDLVTALADYLGDVGGEQFALGAWRIDDAATGTARDGSPYLLLELRHRHDNRTVWFGAEL